MHICHITTAHTAFDTRIFRRECISLAKAGFKVTLIAQNEHEAIVDGVHIIPLSKPRTVLERRFLTTYQAFELAMPLKADLYHFHDPELIPVMRRLARLTGCPVVWDAHENYVSSLKHFNQLRVPLASWLAAEYFDRLEIKACRREFSGVVTINELMAKRYQAYTDHLAILGNYVDISLLPDPPMVNRSIHPRLVSSGWQSKERCVTEVADAFCIARKKIHCEVAFWGTFEPHSLEAELGSRALFGNAPSEDVIIGGPYPWKTLVEELIPTAWAACVLFNPNNPNNVVGLPNRIFEYWANHVPVICTAGTQVARIVEEEGAGIIIADNNPASVANAFLEIVKDIALVKKMGDDGRQAVEKKYNWANAFQNLLNLYADLGVVP